MGKNNFFSYQANDNYKLEEIAQNKYYNLYTLTYPSPVNTPFAENNTVCCRYYQPPEADKAIIILHGLEGEFYSRHFSTYLAKQGISCLQIPMPYSKTRVPKRKLKYIKNEKIDFSDMFITGLKQAVLDTRSAAGWLEKRYKNLGILGISLGVIIASITAEVDNRFKSAVYILGGGDPANLLWDSKSLMVKFYKKIVSRNISLKHLKGKWKVIDPVNYARGNADNILMINARYDITVPPVYSKKLWKALGKPTIRWLKCDHFTAGFFMPFMHRESARHFNKTLT